MSSLRSIKERVVLAAPREDPRGERVVVRRFDEARSLLEAFARGSGRRLRSVLARLPHTGDVSGLSDHEVLDQVARALVAGRIVAYRHRDDVQGLRIPGKEELPSAAPTEKALTWVEIVLVDDEGHPVPNEAYLLRLPDGTELPGHLDAKGRAFVDKIPGGKCQVSFPDLDESEWQAV